jgi:hypothetical protein
MTRFEMNGMKSGLGHQNMSNVSHFLPAGHILYIIGSKSSLQPKTFRKQSLSQKNIGLIGVAILDF